MRWYAKNGSATFDGSIPGDHMVRRREITAKGGKYLCAHARIMPAYTYLTSRIVQFEKSAGVFPAEGIGKLDPRPQDPSFERKAGHTYSIHPSPPLSPSHCKSIQQGSSTNYTW